ncbi:MAG: YceK/YidQ family lipoprotein [Akkermansiaceae bacterium]|nr:YceK/YidQ family lipoprotein [Akkermansiaceae bacterium]
MMTIIAISLLCSNCATLLERTTSTPNYEKPYPATKMNIEAVGTGITGPDNSHDWRCAGPFDSASGRIAFGISALLDLPFSLAFDTLFLPFDLASKSKPSHTEVAE